MMDHDHLGNGIQASFIWDSSYRQFLLQGELLARLGGSTGYHGRKLVLFQPQHSQFHSHPNLATSS